MTKLIVASLIVMFGFALGADQKAADPKDPTEHVDRTPPPALTGMEAAVAQFEHYADAESLEGKYQYYSRLKNLNKTDVLTAKWDAGGIGLSEIMPEKSISVSYETIGRWQDVDGEVLYTPGLKSSKKNAHAYQPLKVVSVPPDRQIASVKEQPTLTSRIYADLRDLGKLDVSFVSSVSNRGEASYRLLSGTSVSLQFRARKVTDRLKETGSPGKTWTPANSKDVFVLPAVNGTKPGEALLTVRAEDFEDEVVTLEILATDGHAFTSGTVTAYLPKKR